MQLGFWFYKDSQIRKAVLGLRRDLEFQTNVGAIKDNGNFWCWTEGILHYTVLANSGMLESKCEVFPIASNVWLSVGGIILRGCGTFTTVAWLAEMGCLKVALKTNFVSHRDLNSPSWNTMMCTSQTVGRPRHGQNCFSHHVFSVMMSPTELRANLSCLNLCLSGIRSQQWEK